MAIDANIALGVKPLELPDPINRMAQVLAVQAAQTQNAVGQYGLAKAQRQDEETNRMAQLLSGGNIDLTTPEGQAKLYAVAPTQAPGLIKGQFDIKKLQSDIGKNDAEAGKAQADTAAKVTAQYRDQLANVNTPEQAAQWLTAQYKDPVLSKVVGNMPLEAALAQIPADAQAFQQWRQQNALGMSKFIELNKPTTSVVNTGGQTQMVQTPGLGGAPEVAGTMQNTVSPNAVLEANTSRANNAATNATSRANNADTIKKDLQVAGLSNDGSGVNPNVEQMAQAIAAGRAAPITGFALAKPQGQTVMRRVFEINPSYDETTYGAKAKAARDFTSGPQGNALRSVQTANAHLDQMNELADALNNGNVPVVNMIANRFAKETGNPAPTNFDAVKSIIGQEVVKAIVAGGGTGGERDEAAAAFSNAKSPAQLKGVIQHYRMVMGAQEANLLAQRDAAGLPRSTLPAYNAGGHGGAPGAPTGWQYLGVQPAGGN